MSYCDDCLHREVCGEENARDEAIEFCGYKLTEPKTGHWIGDKAYPICPKCNCNIIEEYISCSDYAEMYKPMKYCPNCGARMQESERV